VIKQVAEYLIFGFFLHLPRKHKHTVIVALGEKLHSQFNVLDKSACLAALKVGNEPLIFISTIRRAALPDTVAADDYEGGGSCHGIGGWCGAKWSFRSNLLV
jgi:hypothetical protein